MIAPLHHLAVVPILVGPLQVFLAMLPAILFGIGSALLALFKPATFKLALRLLWRMKVSIVVAVVLVSGTVFAARAVWRGAGTIRQAEADAHDWPLFRGNARRTGAAESGGAPLEGGVNWAFASEAKTFYSSPTVVGNRVYATSAEVGVFSNRGAIYCLDADTGGVVWKSVPEGMRATFSSPSVSGKYLVTGEGLHQVRDGRVTCLDITRGGAVLWTFRTKSHVESSPAIADGRAIVGAGDDGYYCFRLEPDAKGEPVLLWHLPGSQYHDAENDPIVHEGRAYLGLGINGQAIVCVDAASGRELWRVATSAPVFSPPSIARGKLFIGMGHGDFVNSEEVVIANELESLRAAGKTPAELEAAKARLQPGGEAWCIDLATHQVEWKFKTDSSVLGAIVAGEDRLFIASRAGTVYSLGFDGKPLATWNARAPIIASLAATGSHVYAVTESGRLFALEQNGLQPVWETRLGNAGTFLSSPAIARGHVYAGTPEDGLLCVGKPSGQGEERIWAGELGGAGAGGNPEGTSLPLDGMVEWRWPAKDDDTIVAPAAADENRLFVPLSGPVRKGVACLQIDARPLEPPSERWFFQTQYNVVRSPGASREAVVFSDGEENDFGHRLHYLSAAWGREVWSAEMDRDASGFACLTPNAVLAEERVGSLTSFSLDGKVRWRASLSLSGTPSEKHRLAGIPCVADSRVVVATADELMSEAEFSVQKGPYHRNTESGDTRREKGWSVGKVGELVMLDEIDGKPLWKVSLPEAPTNGPLVHGKVILVPTVVGILAYRLVDGKRLWQSAFNSIGVFDPVKSPLVRCGNFFAATTLAQELVVIDPETGTAQARQPGALGALPPLPIPGALLFVASDGLWRFDLAQQTVTPWLVNSLTPSITTPVIVTGEAAYFVTDGHRLVRAGKGAP